VGEDSGCSQGRTDTIHHTSFPIQQNFTRLNSLPHNRKAMVVTRWLSPELLPEVLIFYPELFCRLMSHHSHKELELKRLNNVAQRKALRAVA
jgi:hypothetical protein